VHARWTAQRVAEWTGARAKTARTSKSNTSRTGVYFYPYVRANSLYFYIRILTTDTRNTAFLVFILLFSASPFHPDAAAVAAHDTDYM
jgi:hypothetical protein